MKLMHYSIAASLLLFGPSSREVFGQAECAAGGNLRGIRVDGELMAFRTSIRAVVPAAAPEGQGEPWRRSRRTVLPRWRGPDRHRQPYGRRPWRRPRWWRSGPQRGACRGSELSRHLQGRGPGDDRGRDSSHFDDRTSLSKGSSLLSPCRVPITPGARLSCSHPRWKQSQSPSRPLTGPLGQMFTYVHRPKA